MIPAFRTANDECSSWCVRSNILSAAHRIGEHFAVGKFQDAAGGDSSRQPRDFDGEIL
jgi:hypothetical protein